MDESGGSRGEKVVRFSPDTITHFYDQKLPVTERLLINANDILVCPLWTQKAASATAKLKPETLKTLFDCMSGW